MKKGYVAVAICWWIAASSALADEKYFAHLPRSMSHHEVVSEKRGTVVDATSRQPIVGAIVVATWIWNNQTLHGRQSNCIAEQGAVTDSDGKFRLPDVSQELDSDFASLGIPRPLRSFESVRWHVVVFKEGLVETQLLPLLNDPAFGDGLPRAAGADTETAIEGNDASGGITVAPIAMTEKQLGFVKYIGYLDSMRIADNENCDFAKHTSEYSQLREKVAALADRLPCREPPTELVPPRVVQTFEVIDFKNRAQIARNLNAQGHAQFSPNVTARELCAAAKEAAVK